ncbi:tyrosine-type recombinase/integrase [Maricaulaceae bacterium EIL42A08]|nr:tyrosine-type recombinase/integrase [Maricaulaceae bacterium EIL42A08]
MSYFIDDKVDAVLVCCEGAFSEMTLKGYRSDLVVFCAWCDREGVSAYPADSETVARFISDETARVLPSTLKRRLAAIRFVHVYGDLADPTKASSVRLAMRRATMLKARRPRQAEGLTFDTLQKILKACPPNLEGYRDAALISVGYDTLTRSCELVAMEVEDFNLRDGASSVLIRRAKSDQAGDGRIAWLSDDTAERVRDWLEAAGINRGPVFRAVNRRVPSGSPLQTSSVRRAVKKAARRAGLKESATRLSAHSMRVGGAQDMLVTGFDALAIMQAGGWTTPNMVLRYVEHAQAGDLQRRRWASLQALPSSTRRSALA